MSQAYYATYAMHIYACIRTSIYLHDTYTRSITATSAFHSDKLSVANLFSSPNLSAAIAANQFPPLIFCEPKSLQENKHANAHAAFLSLFSLPFRRGFRSAHWAFKQVPGSPDWCLTKKKKPRSVAIFRYKSHPAHFQCPSTECMVYLPRKLGRLGGKR